MLRSRGTDLAGTICTGCRNRAPDHAEEFASCLQRRYAHRQAGEPSRAEQRCRTVIRSRQHQGKGAGPEGPRESFCSLIQYDAGGHGFHIAIVTDQGVEAGSAFGGEDSRHRFVIGGICTEPINRLGRKGYKATGAQNLRCRLQVGFVKLEQASWDQVRHGHAVSPQRGSVKHANQLGWPKNGSQLRRARKAPSALWQDPLAAESDGAASWEAAPSSP